MDAAVVVEISRQLEVLRLKETVAIPLAIESGSRAWGFPSPDSDYDCRFIYVRKPERYLTLFPPRDVIELPMTAVLDINGWDLSKALKLLLKGNAVVIEWLTSPLTYIADEMFRAEALVLAEQVADRSAVMRHYHHLALGQRRLLMGDDGSIKLKKLFYVLRPLLAYRWLEARPHRVVAPMHFPTLCAEADVPAPVLRQIEEQVARKAVSREMGRGSAPPDLLQFAHAELAKAMPTSSPTSSAPEDGIRAADQFFRRWIEKQSDRTLSTAPPHSPP